MTAISSALLTQAAQFRAKHHDYFFEDAHFHVEAAASVEAKEIAHNVFEFEDKSILRIGGNVPVVQVYLNRAELDSFVALRSQIPAPGIILPQDC